MRLLKNSTLHLLKNFYNIWTALFIWILILCSVEGSRSNKKRNGRGYAAKIPTIISQETNYTYSTGKLAVLYCTVENLGTKTVVWRRADDPNPLTVAKFTFVGDSRIQVHHVVHKDQWNLHIRNASKKDEGVYECQVSTSDRSIRKNFLLTINDEPPPVIKMSGKLIVEIAGTLKLTCNASGGTHPLDSINWFKDGNAIERDGLEREVDITESYSIAKKTIQSTLKIRKVRMDDAGTYLCRVSDLVTHKKVHVLNSETSNVKRGTSYDFMHEGNGITSSHVWYPVMYLCILLLLRIL